MRPTSGLVAIVTGGSSGAGREIARSLAGQGHAIVVVYLDDQRSVEATVDAILAARGTAVAIRADVTDELDVERVFTESVAAFGEVDVLVHTTTDDPSVLYRYATRHAGPGRTGR
jgi:NAD(P)-dependent dehydrogenase (short-subunit alcohol dehydrogenase family)